MDTKYMKYCFKFLFEHPEEVDTYAMNFDCLSDEMKHAVTVFLSLAD